MLRHASILAHESCGLADDERVASQSESLIPEAEATVKSSVSLRSTDYSRADVLGVPCKSVNTGAKRIVGIAAFERGIGS